MDNQRNFAQLQAPVHSPFPVNLSAPHGMRASSNPEHGQPQPQPQEALIRHLPGPPPQLSAPQGHFPIQRLTPSTQDLEHMYPGSTSRGDFHSDPTAPNAMDPYSFEPPNSYFAIPSRGLPGPFIYRPLRTPAQLVPIANRMSKFDGNLPKGKKNPKKKSSDDARMVSNTGDGSGTATNGSNTKRAFAGQNIQMHFYPPLPDSTPLAQELCPPSGATPYSNDYKQPDLPPGSGNKQAPFQHSLNRGQNPIQPTIEDRSRERVVSNPFSPHAHRSQGSTQDPNPTISGLPIRGNGQHQIATATGQLLEENAGLESTQTRPHIPQPLDPYALGHQLPDRRMQAQHRQDRVPEAQRPALALMSNVGQPQLPENLGRSRPNDIPRRPMQEGCKIWIGGIPSEFDKVAVMDLLRPCRGLLDISEPKVSPLSKKTINHSYAFAGYVLLISTILRNTNLSDYSFQSPFDAAEALERLPQTRFAELPEGTFLSTNYPKPKWHPPADHHEHRNDGSSKRPEPYISPTNPRKNDDRNRAGEFKHEHGRKPSKCWVRGKKLSTSSSEGKLRRSSEHFIAVDVGQKESNLQYEETGAVQDLHDMAGSIAQASSSSAEGQGDSKQMKEDPAVVQPDFRVETYVSQVSRITGDGAQEIAPASGVKSQVHDSQQATSSRYIEGHAKTPKKNSRGFNKLPVPEMKGSGPPTGQPTSGAPRPTAQVRSSTKNPGKVLKNSGQLENKGKQDESKNEATKITARTVPSESNSNLPKDLETPDQSFLGRNPTDDDGGQPNISVANATEPRNARKDQGRVSENSCVLLESAASAVPLQQSKEPTIHAMRRDVSSSTQGSANIARSFSSSTAPPSSSLTERSNSTTQEIMSPMAQAGCSFLETALFPSSYEQRETAMEQESEIQKSPAPSEAEKDTKSVQEELRSPINGESGGFGSERTEENPGQAQCMLSTQSSLSSPKRASLTSPTRKRAPSIPPRSSSLAAPSTPIKTHLKKRKKKPPNFTPVNEAPSEDDIGSSLKATGLVVNGTRMDLRAQTIGSIKLNFPLLTVNPTARSPTTKHWKELPKPETPFLMDDGVRVIPPKFSCQTMIEASNADRYYAQKSNYQVFHLGDAMRINADFNSLDSSDTLSTNSSGKSTPDHTSAKRQKDGLETTLREAGFRSLSGISPFPIKNPELAFFETIDEEGNLLENRINKDGHVVSWFDDRGKLGPSISFGAWTKQEEMIDVVKKATAVKRLLAGSPTWTKIESLRQQLSQMLAYLFSDARGQKTTEERAQQTLGAKNLLDTIPHRGSPTSEMQKWSRNASIFVEENISEPSLAYTQSLKPTTNGPVRSSQGTPSRKQRQEYRHPVLINKPNPRIVARKLGKGEDGVETVNTDLCNSLTSENSTGSESSPSTFGCRTPSEEQLIPSVALVPSAAFNQVSKLKDLFVEMGKDRRRWSGNGHPVSIPQAETRMTSSEPELDHSGEDSDESKLMDVKDVEPEPGFKEGEDEGQQKPYEDEKSESKGKEEGSVVWKGDQSISAKSDKIEDPSPVESKSKASQKAEYLTDQEQNPQPLGVLSSSFDSNLTANEEGNSEETQHSQPRGVNGPLNRSRYNAVAGRGTDAKRRGTQEGSKDPWALPQGEKPWGSDGKGQGEKKKRQRQ